MTGKRLRLRRILDPATRRGLVLPLDHPVTMGVAPGLEDLRRVAELGNANGADAVVVHKGALRSLVERGDLERLDRLGAIVHLSASTAMGPRPARKLLVCGVDEALELGADAVSVHINFGCSDEPAMLEDLAEVSRQAERRGVPLLAMTYVRDDSGRDREGVRELLHAARVAEELGADLVKMSFPGVAGLEEAVRGIRTPLLIAGGSRLPEAALFDTATKAVALGAAGVAVGRNVFQAEDPAAVIAKLAVIVHGEGRNGRRRTPLTSGDGTE